ncbi:Fumarylacetoacetase [Hyaloscypha variabilis F]|uniref:Fumarylacetoacetase n=1 Tax=Hyaloscypha variabilis (strain UAMH 11265 / GT02V1 / F) TaxID=1149755 RepID=A0A2J6RLM0_HYAVF|nr:Fumarylacetoacetase [Hyaloscypha variabilis F]
MYSHHFSINNIPFGIASSSSHPDKAAATRFEDTVIFLDELAKYHSSLSSSTVSTFSLETLNSFAALPKSQHAETRKWIQSHLTNIASLPPSTKSPISETTLHLPLSIGDFTDFSCSRSHVLNAAEAVFGKRSLPPGFEYFPVGYHGRTSSIVPSGTPIVRPNGQYRDEEGKVVFGATKRLDYELEVAAVIGKPSVLGEPVAIENADEYIFGCVLLNDWSARDIQGFEMTPLGPLHGKSFATTISPWVITLDALSPFKIPAVARNSDIILPLYLQDPDPLPTFEIELKAEIQPKDGSEATVICKSKFSSLYWTLRDLVAQQTVNGCSLRTGDLLVTGTISGDKTGENGCLLEMVAKGGIKVKNVKGTVETKMFFDDGDTVCLSAYAGEGVGFGDCVGTILPAK